jgi:ankyrin repeat protein
VAAKRGNVPVLHSLLAMGAVPPATRTRLLVLGVAHPAILRVLLAVGAPPNALAAVGAAPAQSPLMAAAVQYELESVAVLLAGGASVDFPDGAGRTALMRCVGGDGCDPAIIRALIDAGADVNARDAARATALWSPPGC